MTEEQLSLDCYHKAETNEGKFTLIGRDSTAPELVRLWVALRAGDFIVAARCFAKLCQIARDRYGDEVPDQEQLRSALAEAEKMDRFAKRTQQ